MAKLLLVEDDNNLREIYQARLSAEGYDIVAAQNGEEALSVAKQHRPDLIISDVMMPRISGFEMLDILRTTPELANTKVIMLTALGQAEDQARADKLGADKYLVKSQVTLEDIVNCARDLLNGTTVVTPNPDQTTTTTTAATATAVSATADMSTASPAVDQPIAPVSTQDADPNPIPPPATPTQPDPTAVPAPGTDTSLNVPLPAPMFTQPIDTSLGQPVAQPVITTVQDPDPLVLPTMQATNTPPPPAATPTPIVTHQSGMIANPEAETPGTTPVEATVDKPEQTAAVPPSSPQVEVPVNIVAADTHAATEQQTSAAEEASVESQIAAFANNQTTSSVSPLPPSTDSQSVTDSNEAALTEAVEDLAAAVNEPPAMILPPSQKTVPGEETTTVTNADVQEPTNVTPSASPSTEAVVENAAAASPPVLPTDTVPQSASPESVATPPTAPSTDESDQVNVAGKKVIRPINDITSGPNLDELLAKEVAKEEAAPGTPQPTVATSAPAAPAQQPVATAPSAGEDPNSIAL